ncbi:cupin domain-containing protein [Streptomyces sp. RTd22]|uniref:cupin domain-containing protein n=1 Tax=Streptomyces sp. RTd22 TaxID=1841249 RepID=UPI000A5F1F31|nr:cupin domain-containing protein [Streptomyces sp. RTd22]
MTTETTSGTTGPYEAIEKLGTSPLWRYYGELFTAEPRSKAVPHLWSYRELRPHMLHFAGALSLEEAERRVLMLVNSGMTEPPATVNSLYAGIQIILPGETAQAHRHTANAFRFIIEGEGAYTTVNGERVHMRPGDLLLTPGWHWHDHYHEGDGPMMRLDGLDYPLVNALEAASSSSTTSAPSGPGGRTTCPAGSSSTAGSTPCGSSRTTSTPRSATTRGARRTRPSPASATTRPAAATTVSCWNTATRTPAAPSCPPSPAGSRGSARASTAPHTATRPAPSTTSSRARAARK